MSDKSPSQTDLNAIGVTIAFGDMAVARGFVTETQVRECLDVQAELSKKNIKKLLGEVMIERGYLLPHQVHALCEQQRQSQYGSFPKFQLIGKLGEGGMGSVLKARRLSDGQPVAIKVLLKRLAANQEYLQRFYREAQLGLAMDHPNVVRCLEVGESDGMHFMALEYVDGEDLGQELKRRPFFLEGQALAIVLAAARGIGYAHKLGLIHRDVKPANIMLTRRGEVKVMDFGLARIDREDHQLTLTGALLGTPHYMAPEQVESKVQIDARTDMYSLGTTLFHMLTGRPPFIGRNIYDILMSHVNESVRDPREFNTNISEETAKLVLWMCAKDREKRLPGMEQLAAELCRSMGLSPDEPSAQPIAPIRLTTPNLRRASTRDAALKSVVAQLNCPRCKAEFRGDPTLLVEGQRLKCESCGLVYPCPLTPPAPPALTADDIVLEAPEEPRAPSVALPRPKADVDLTLQEPPRELPPPAALPAKKKPWVVGPAQWLAAAAGAVALAWLLYSLAIRILG